MSVPVIFANAKFRFRKIVSKYHLSEIMTYACSSLRGATDVFGRANSNLRLLMIQNFKIIFEEYEQIENDQHVQSVTTFTPYERSFYFKSNLQLNPRPLTFEVQKPEAIPYLVKIIEAR